MLTGLTCLPVLYSNVRRTGTNQNAVECTGVYVEWEEEFAVIWFPSSRQQKTARHNINV